MSAGLIRRVSRDGHSDTGRLISILYFANSIGAAVGVLVAGFYLIGVAGLPGTLLTAAIINLLVGLTVFGAVRLVHENDEPEAEGAPPHQTMENTPPAPELPMLWRVLLIVAAGTALSSFVYEIAWVRMLSLVLGSATHSFELMLSAFILGLSLGAFWVRTRADTFRDPVRALGVTQWAMGALAILTLSAYLVSFDWMAFLIQGLDQNAEGYQLFTVAKYGIALGKNPDQTPVFDDHNRADVFRCHQLGGLADGGLGWSGEKFFSLHHASDPLTEHGSLLRLH